MKTSTRFFLGLFSSLLLSAGFVQAAECLDPISQAAVVSGPDLSPEDSPARACSFPCHRAPDLEQPS